MTNGWQAIRLGEVLRRVKAELTIDDSVTYKQVTVRLWNKGVVLRGEQEGLTIKTKRQFYVKTGQLLMSRIDVRNGAIGLVPRELDGAIVSNDFWAYEFEENKLFPRFLAHYVTTPGFIEDANRTSSGTTKRIRAEETAFLNIQIPLPLLDEQRRIVERVETLAARIAKAHSLREEANKEADKLFSAESFKLFSEIKDEHEARSFGSFSPHVTSGPRYWRDRYSEIGHRFYRAQDIGSRGNILPNSKAYVTPPDSDQGKTALLEHGDLMIVITGATVGRCAVYTDDLEPGYVSQHVSICRLPQDKVLPSYALLWLLSPDGQQQLLGQRYGQGKPGLNLTNIRSITIPVPPLGEQRRIVAYLDSVQARLASLRELQSATGEELDALLPSVLDRAFKGEL